MKQLKRLVASLLVLGLLLGVVPVVFSSAAAVPTISCTNDGMTMLLGGSSELVFLMSNEYLQQQYVISIYTPGGKLLGNAQEEITADSEYVELTIPLDGDFWDLTQGTYTIKYYISYYDNGTWNNTQEQTAYFHVLKSSCKGSHSYGQEETVFAPSCDLTGRGRKVCTVCGDTVFTVLAARHTYTDDEDQTCDACGWVRQEAFLWEDDGQLKYFVDGYFTQYTGLFQWEEKDYYVVKGVVDRSYIGAASCDGKWYYLKDGVVDVSFTGICLYNGSWYYFKNGKLDWGYTGLCIYSGRWYYIKNGKLDWSYTGLCKHNDRWYYVAKGRLEWNYTGLCSYNGSWYFVRDSRLDWGYTGLSLYNGRWYYIKNGKLDWSYTGLCKHSDRWYYVAKGRLEWNYTGLCLYNGSLYYVKDSRLDWGYSGTALFEGKKYTVKNGKVQ